MVQNSLPPLRIRSSASLTLANSPSPYVPSPSPSHHSQSNFATADRGGLPSRSEGASSVLVERQGVHMWILEEHWSRVQHLGSPQHLRTHRPSKHRQFIRWYHALLRPRHQSSVPCWQGWWKHQVKQREGREERAYAYLNPDTMRLWTRHHTSTSWPSSSRRHPKRVWHSSPSVPSTSANARLHEPSSCTPTR